MNDGQPFSKVRFSRLRAWRVSVCVTQWRRNRPSWCQKRPTIVSKETYYSVERDLLCVCVTQWRRRLLQTLMKEGQIIIKRTLYDALLYSAHVLGHWRLRIFCCVFFSCSPALFLPVLNLWLPNPAPKVQRVYTRRTSFKSWGQKCKRCCPRIMPALLVPILCLSWYIFDTRTTYHIYIYIKQRIIYIYIYMYIYI
jgi:hypothetical protein